MFECSQRNATCVPGTRVSRLFTRFYNCPFTLPGKLRALTLGSQIAFVNFEDFGPFFEGWAYELFLT